MLHSLNLYHVYRVTLSNAELLAIVTRTGALGRSAVGIGRDKSTNSTTCLKPHFAFPFSSIQKALTIRQDSYNLC